MPDPSFDWGLFLQAQQQRANNQQNMYRDIAGIGQGLGQGLGAIGDAMREKKKQAIVNQLVQAVKNSTTPVQGPAGYVPPNQGPGSTAVPAGQMPPMNKANIAALGIQAQPNSIETLLPELLKSQKPQMEWAPLPGGTTQSGQPIFYDKTTHKTEIGNVPGGIKSTGYANTMGPIRKSQYTLQDLPSNQGPSTAGGAAYQVMVGSQQGMNLIAKAGSVQRTGLATGDLARTILRNSPTDEALRNANFSDNLITRFGQLKQQLTADPTALSNPKIRKEMYSIFSEMRNSARPFIQNQLDDMNDAGFPVTPMTRKRQLGETLPVIPFQDDTSTGTATSGGGWSVVR